MRWVDRLQEATNRHRESLDLGWAELESDLGTLLPKDYKELCARFEPGSFSGFVSLLRGGGDPLYDLRSDWSSCKSVIERNSSSRLFTPYRVYGVDGNQSLIRWGRADMVECRYYQLADEAVDPGEWPVVGVRQLEHRGVNDQWTGSNGGYDATSDARRRCFDDVGYVGRLLDDPECHR